MTPTCERHTNAAVLGPTVTFASPRGADQGSVFATRAIGNENDIVVPTPSSLRTESELPD